MKISAAFFVHEGHGNGQKVIASLFFIHVPQRFLVSPCELDIRDLPLVWVVTSHIVIRERNTLHAGHALAVKAVKLKISGFRANHGAQYRVFLQ